MMNVFTQPLCHEKDVTQGQFLSRVKLVQIQLLFYTGGLTEPSLPYWVGKTDEYMPFSKALAQSESQTIKTRNLTREADSIFFLDDKRTSWMET